MRNVGEEILRGLAASAEESPELDLAQLEKLTPNNNRAQRRKLEQDKKRLRRKENKVVVKMTENHEKKLAQLENPATIRDVVEIATSVANDMINDYHKQSNPIIVSTTLHIEIIKAKLIEKGLVTAEEFEYLFEESVKEFNNIRSEKLRDAAQGLEEIEDEVGEELWEPHVEKKELEKVIDEGHGGLISPGGIVVGYNFKKGDEDSDDREGTPVDESKVHNSVYNPEGPSTKGSTKES